VKNKKVGIIGAGYSGLASACYLAKAGYDVTIYEKNATIGGRSRQYEHEGFIFDMGPSWYWMPDVFETFFNDFGKKVSDYYDLVRLSPSYRVYFGKEDFVDLPANMEGMFDLFESIEKGSADKLKTFLSDAQYKYEVGINDLVQKPSKSIMEFATIDVMKGVFKLQLFKSFSKFVRQYFKNPKLIQILEFPVLFLGAKPENIPALYSLMNYADIKLGTWYPMGGMFKVIEGMEQLAIELGVKILTNQNVQAIKVDNKLTDGIKIDENFMKMDALVASADYNFVEQKLLPVESRKYDQKYWDSRVMAPSSLLFYLGVNKRLKNLLHHNLFFDEDFGQHAIEIYDQPKWPSKPLFYTCVPSITDNSVAPEGHENVFLLIPIAPGLIDTEKLREEYYDKIMTRLEALTEQSIREHVIYKRSYAVNDFIKDYNAFKGNAYGLANTLKQTAIMKPSMHSQKVKNLFYTGQLTVPGPGVPPSIISGKVVAIEVNNYLTNSKN
jgi:phytoene desaturase